MSFWLVSVASCIKDSVLMSRHLILNSLLCVVIFITGTAHKAHAGTNQELQVFHRHSNLDSGLSDWSDWQLYWKKQQDSDTTLYVELNDLYHFDVPDQQVAIGKYIQSSARLKYQTELTASTNHSLYPTYSLYGAIENKSNKPLIINTGLRYSHFDKYNSISMLNSSANSLLFTGRLEYYSGNNLYSYSLYYTQMQGLSLSDTAATHSLKYAYIYNEKSNIYLAYARGDEIDFDPANTALSISATQSTSLGGTHWMNPSLAIVYTVARHTISSANFGYQRDELYIGLRKLY